MTIEIACAHCGEDYKVKDEAAGRTFTCKACGKKVRIPIVDDDDGYGGDDEEDDYVREKPRKPKRKSGSKGSSKTLGPAVGLYVTAGLWLAYGLFNIVVVMAAGAAARQPPPGADEATRMGFIIGFYSSVFLLPLLNIVILAGAVCLQTCRAYPMAMIACIIASIPCCSPIVVLGMPFGIWGLVVLMNDDVKRAFR